jgi:hypothetical protein
MVNPTKNILLGFLLIFLSSCSYLISDEKTVYVETTQPTETQEEDIPLIYPMVTDKSAKVTNPPKLPPERDPSVKFSEAIARELDKTNPSTAKYWREFVASDIFKATITDQKLERWTDNVCIFKDNTITAKEVKRDYFVLYLQFVNTPGRAIEFNTTKGQELIAMGIDEDKLNAMLEEVIYHAVKIHCPRKNITLR